MNKSETIVLVLGGGTNALGQIRAAHSAGYMCVNLAEKNMHCYTTKSNKCNGYISPHPYKQREACLEFTMNIIKSLPSKPFIFCASDEWMDLIGENESLFQEVAMIIQSSWEKTQALYNKKMLYRIAEKYGIPYPRTMEIDSLKDMGEAITGITMPIIVKPQLTVSQNEVKKSTIKAYHRTQTFSTIVDARRWCDSMVKAGLDFPVLIQEFIPGGADCLYTLTSFSDREGNLVAGSIGYKLRQFPPEAGRITSGVLHYDQQLEEIARSFLKAVAYYGVANTEFKYDARDGKYKLMEINARFGAWNYSTLFSGINLMKIAIEDYRGVQYDGCTFCNEKEGYIWYNLAQDFGCTVILNKKQQFKKFRLTPLQWKRSLGSKHFEAVWDWKDPKPFIFELFYLIEGKLKGDSPV